MRDLFGGASALAVLAFAVMAVLFLPDRTRRFAKDGMFFSVAVFAFGFVGLMVLEAKKGSGSPQAAYALAPGEPLPQQSFNVSSDPKGRFWLLSVEQRPGNQRVAITRREGSSGVSYSKRLIDCDRQEAMYLASADDFAGLAAEKPDPHMGGLISGSIAWQVAQLACAEQAN